MSTTRRSSATAYRPPLTSWLERIHPLQQGGAPKPARCTPSASKLIAQGQSLRAVAELLGLAPSTLVRACQRAGIVLPRGRRPASDAAP